MPPFARPLEYENPRDAATGPPAPVWMHRAAIGCFVIPAIFQFFYAVVSTLNILRGPMPPVLYTGISSLSSAAWVAGLMFSILYIQRAKRDPVLTFDWRSQRLWLSVWMGLSPIVQFACGVWVALFWYL